LLLDSASRATPQPYELPLPGGTYDWVLAAWKKQGALSPANADSLLREAGFYRNAADTTQPGVVTVSGTGPDSIDFVVDFANMHPVSFYFPWRLDREGVGRRGLGLQSRGATRRLGRRSSTQRHRFRWSPDRQRPIEVFETGLAAVTESSDVTASPDCAPDPRRCAPR
jgi:hypothetical protein